MTKRVDTSELRTTEGVVGLNDYVVNIQKYFNPPLTQLKLIYAVGVLIDLHYIVTTCSMFYDDVHQDITPEKLKYKLFRIVADGVSGHMEEVVDGWKVRFIDKVILHPKCQRTGTIRWTSDVAIAHTSFPFALRPGIARIMKFGHIPGGAVQLWKNRSQNFSTIYRQHTSVGQLSSNSTICQVMSWGRYNKLTVNGSTHTFLPSRRLLLYQVHLADTSYCKVFCNDDDRFCPLTDPTVNPSVFCAVRGNGKYVFGGQDFSAYPCAGTEGSPLVCHPPGQQEKGEIYGLVANIPATACIQRSLPITVTHIEDVSKFVIDVVGNAPIIRATFFLHIVSHVL